MSFPIANVAKGSIKEVRQVTVHVSKPAAIAIQGYMSLLQNSAKGSSIGRGSGKAVRLETSLLIRFGVCLREGSCPPGARASRPHRSGRSPAPGSAGVPPASVRAQPGRSALPSIHAKGADSPHSPWGRAPRNGKSGAQSEAVAVARILFAEKRCGRDARAPGWASPP